jgi:FkbM family methyltransferase
MPLIRILKNPRAYAARVPLSLAGLFHDCFIRKHKAFGCSFVMPREHTSHYERGAAWLRGYEKPECLLVSEFMPPDATVLELGACLGVVSCVLNKKLLRPERHVAVEGNPRIIESLGRNRELNGCRFQIENCVVSHRSSEEFFLGASIVLSGRDHSGGEPVQVAGRSISDLERKYGFSFDFLVMDIEGREYDMLTNHRGSVKHFRGIVLEKHPQILGQAKVRQYEAALFEMGFTKVKSLASVDYFRNTSVGA